MFVLQLQVGNLDEVVQTRPVKSSTSEGFFWFFYVSLFLLGGGEVGLFSIVAPDRFKLNFKHEGFKSKLGSSI